MVDIGPQGLARAVSMGWQPSRGNAQDLEGLQPEEVKKLWLKRYVQKASRRLAWLRC